MQVLDALVVGAGPTGLMMAEELARYGLRVRIIDKALGPSNQSKALAIQSRTLEIFDQIGIVKKFIDQGAKIESFSPIYNQKILTTLEFAYLDADYPFVLSLEQSKTEAILAEHLASYNIQVERGMELLSFSQEENQIQVQLLDIKTGKEERMTISWLLGCDGAHSKVRKQLGLQFEGEEFPKVFALADVEIEWNHPHTKGLAFFDATGVIAAFPLPEEKRYRVIFLSEKEPTLEMVESILHEKGDDPHAKVGAPRWMTNFRIHSRMVNQYRKERVFVVGDAAHIHSPVGGQGMNTGIQDAYNLAWKLAFVHTKKAEPKLLDSYSFERFSVGKALLEGTKRATWMVTLQSPLLCAMRNIFLQMVTKIPWIKRKLLSLLSQLAIRYPKSSWICEGSRIKHGVPVGKRAPNAALFYEGKKTTLFNLWRHSKQFHLLLIGSLKVRKKFSELIEVYEITSACDPEREVRSHYGEEVFYLIRPDGYIAFRGNIEDIDLIESFCATGLRLVHEEG